MRTLTKQELKKILNAHNLWVADNACSQRASLSRADLSEANLSRADLSEADLSRANLSRADLSRANLSRANLSRADLFGANLFEANLFEANLFEATLPQFQIVPQIGTFYAYKKVYTAPTDTPAIVTLKISKAAARTSTLVGRKCRASRCLVVSIVNMYTGEAIVKGYSRYDNDFEYLVGQVVEVADFDPDIRVECTRGVHFFMTEDEARAY